MGATMQYRNLVVLKTNPCTLFTKDEKNKCQKQTLPCRYAVSVLTYTGTYATLPLNSYSTQCQWCFDDYDTRPNSVFS